MNKKQLKQPTSYPSVKIDKDMKLRLLKACAAGELFPDDFPELFAVTPKALRFLTDEQLDAKIKELERKNKMIKG